MVPTDWGPNLALAPGVTAAAAGQTMHPTDKADTPVERAYLQNDVSKIINGELENAVSHAAQGQWSMDEQRVGVSRLGRGAAPRSRPRSAGW